MSDFLKGAAAAATLSLALLATPAFAQKSKDTLRYPLAEAENAIDVYIVRGNFSQEWGPAVYDTLLDFDAKTGEFIPHLAKAWSQPDPLTYEFELRDDVKWHDGQPFTADDVVYILNYLIDPKSKLRFKSSWDWMQSIEKLGPNKIRIKAKIAMPGGMMYMAYGWPIYPKHLMEPLADKELFGTKPIGTGPYRIAKLDKNAGIVAEKYKDYVPSSWKPAAAIGRVIAEPIPDEGTQVAALLTGKADMVKDLPMDQALALQQSGRFQVRISPPTLGYTFLGFPSAGAQSVKALADQRVRTAIVKAIDRKALVEVQYGSLGSKLPPAESLCFREELGCGYSTAIPDYDPAAAKKLLAEAGYADGFDLIISCFTSGVPEATAISGMLRAVGIRATVSPHQIAQRTQMLNQGKVQMSYYGWSGIMFDVQPHVTRHFLTDEFTDPVLIKMASDSLTILDETQRRAAVAKVFDYGVEKSYALPMVENRDVYTHTKEVDVNVPDVRLISANPNNFVWK